MKLVDPLLVEVDVARLIDVVLPCSDQNARSDEASSDQSRLVLIPARRGSIVVGGNDDEAYASEEERDRELRIRSVMMCESETLSVPDKARIREGSSSATGSKPSRTLKLVTIFGRISGTLFSRPFLASFFLNESRIKIQGSERFPQCLCSGRPFSMRFGMDDEMSLSMSITAQPMQRLLLRGRSARITWRQQQEQQMQTRREGDDQSRRASREAAAEHGERVYEKGPRPGHRRAGCRPPRSPRRDTAGTSADTRTPPA